MLASSIVQPKFFAFEQLTELTESGCAKFFLYFFIFQCQILFICDDVGICYSLQDVKVIEKQ